MRIPTLLRISLTVRTNGDVSLIPKLVVSDLPIIILEMAVFNHLFSRCLILFRGPGDLGCHFSVETVQSRLDVLSCSLN